MPHRRSLVLFPALAACVLLVPVRAHRSDKTRLHAGRNASEAAAALQLPGIVVAWETVNVIYDSYQMYKRGKAMYDSYMARSAAVRQIAEGNTAQTAALVRAANQELGEGRGRTVREAMQSNAYLQFKAMLDTFRHAQRMCIQEERLLNQPSRYLVRKLQPLSPAEREALAKAKQVIQSIVDSMQAVIDHSVCPRLAEEIKEDLAIGQANAEAWEEMTTMKGAVIGWSWYEMQYSGATGGIASRGGALSLELQEQIRKLGAKADVVDFDTCYRQAHHQHRRPTLDGLPNVDEYEVSFGDGLVEHMEELQKLANEAQQAFDRASMNLGQYERDCRGAGPKRKAVILQKFANKVRQAFGRAAADPEQDDRDHRGAGPRGKDGLIDEIRASAASGDERARRQWVAISCDICIRVGCREASVLKVLDLTYSFIRYGIDEMLVKSAKKLLPTWASDILSTIHHAENVLNPKDDKAVEFWFSMAYWLWFAGENVNAGKTCIGLGSKLADTTMPALETMLHDVTDAAERSPEAAHTHEHVDSVVEHGGLTLGVPTMSTHRHPDSVDEEGALPKDFPLMRVGAKALAAKRS